MNKKICFTLFAGLLLIFTTHPAQAQSMAKTDGRWTPYLGCWQLMAENVRNDGSVYDKLFGAGSQTTPQLTVCVNPSDSTSGVTLTTFAAGKQVLEQTMVADGSGRPVSESGCVGTQTSEWSHDGMRLFTRVDMACSNRPKQSVTGLTLFSKGPAWVDIQATEIDGTQQVRVRRFMRTFALPEGATALSSDVMGRALAESQSVGSRPLTQDAIVEASSRVASEAVEAAIVETESRFRLDSHTLTQLANAHVSPNVIDLMVAQSFPSHFRVERPMTLPPQVVTSTAATTPVIPTGQYPYLFPYPYTYYPYGAYDPFFFGYYYSPFAYPYYWGANYYRGPTYYISGGSIISSGPGGSVIAPEGQGGQVVNGRGYTRVRPAGAPDSIGDASPRAATSGVRGGRTTNTGSAAEPSSSSPSSSGSSSGSSSSGSSSSGSSGAGVTSGGYTNGGSSESGGRTAQPR